MEWFLAVPEFRHADHCRLAAVENLGRSFGSKSLAKLRCRGFDAKLQQRANQSRECMYSAMVRTVYIYLTPHRRPCPSRWLYPALPLRRGKVGDGGLVMVVTGRRK